MCLGDGGGLWIEKGVVGGASIFSYSNWFK